MTDRLCRECFNELDDELELGDRCLACDEGLMDTWPWEAWNDFEEIPLEALEEFGESEEPETEEE